MYALMGKMFVCADFIRTRVRSNLDIVRRTYCNLREIVWSGEPFMNRFEDSVSENQVSKNSSWDTDLWKVVSQVKSSPAFQTYRNSRETNILS